MRIRSTLHIRKYHYRAMQKSLQSACGAQRSRSGRVGRRRNQCIHACDVGSRLVNPAGSTKLQVHRRAPRKGAAAASAPVRHLLCCQRAEDAPPWGFQRTVHRIRCSSRQKMSTVVPLRVLRFLSVRIHDRSAPMFTRMVSPSSQSHRSSIGGPMASDSTASLSKPQHSSPVL